MLNGGKMHETLEMVMGVCAALWLVFILGHILFIEYFHLVLKQPITMSTEDWRGVTPSLLLVLSILSAVATSVLKLLLFFI